MSQEGGCSPSWGYFRVFLTLFATWALFPACWQSPGIRCVPCLACPFPLPCIWKKKLEAGGWGGEEFTTLQHGLKEVIWSRKLGPGVMRTVSPHGGRCTGTLPTSLGVRSVSYKGNPILSRGSSRNGGENSISVFTLQDACCCGSHARSECAPGFALLCAGLGECRRLVPQFPQKQSGMWYLNA